LLSHYAQDESLSSVLGVISYADENRQDPEVMRKAGATTVLNATGVKTPRADKRASKARC
jgi:hypothetical protein